MINTDNTSSTGDVSSEEVIYDEAGDIVFEAALLRYLPGLSEAETSAFEAYIEENVEKESFMEDLYKNFPDFGVLLEEEINNLKKDFDQVLAAAAKD